MVDIETARRIAVAVEGATDASTAGRLVFECSGRGFAWSLMERDRPRRPRRPNLGVLAVRCPMERKEMLVAAAPDRFFDDAHYRGCPAVLVRLDVVEEDELAALLTSAAPLAARAVKGRSP